MLQPLLHHNDWVCFADPDSQIATQLDSIEQVQQLISDLPITLKDGYRSCVKKGSMFGLTVAAKQPRDKNRRRWSRILSLLRHGEAKQMFVALTQFKQLGIESLTPLLVLEQRKAGMIMDSWVVYEFREGQPSDVQSLPQIVTLLKQLHRGGYRHNDPNFGNFLLDPDGKLFLIDCVLRPRRGSYTDCIDFFLLSRINNITAAQVDALVMPNRLSLGYWLARTVLGYRSKRSKLKRLLRLTKPKNN